MSGGTISIPRGGPIKLKLAAIKPILSDLLTEIGRDVTERYNDGEIKVRQNDAWAVNYGSSSFNSGSSTNELDLNGSNIPVTSGTYNVILDFSGTLPTITLYKW